jgi:hypothetical protein
LSGARASAKAEANRHQLNGFHQRADDIEAMPDACNSRSIAKAPRRATSTRCCPFSRARAARRATAAPLRQSRG